MAEGALRQGEEITQRRVMEIDVEAVWHVEHDRSKGVPGSGKLAQAHAPGTAAEDDIVVACQIAGIALQPRLDLVADDRGRHIPGGVEHDALDGGFQDRRRVDRRPDDDARDQR